MATSRTEEGTGESVDGAESVSEAGGDAQLAVDHAIADLEKQQEEGVAATFGRVFAIAVTAVLVIVVLNSVTRLLFRADTPGPEERELAAHALENGGRLNPDDVAAFANRKRDQFQRASIAQVAATFVSIVVAVAAMVLVLRATSSKPVTVVTISAVVMLVIGIASREVIADFVSTSMNVVEGVAAIGDRVKVSVRFAGPVEGHVEQIVSRGMMVRGDDSSVTFIPGGNVASILNFSRPSDDGAFDQAARKVVRVGAGTGADIGTLHAVADACRSELHQLFLDNFRFRNTFRGIPRVFVTEESNAIGFDFSVFSAAAADEARAELVDLANRNLAASASAPP